MRVAKWGLMVDGRGGRSGNGGRVGLVGLLLFFLVLLPRQSAGLWAVHAMVLAPIKGKFPDLLPFLALPCLGRFLFPSLIFLRREPVGETNPSDW